MLSGLKLASLYGIYPHELGFCGPQKKSTKGALFDFVSGKKVSSKKIRKILENFSGAYPYYRLIAKSNKIGDPFDEKVIKAYWTGNNLLEKVRTEDLRRMIARDFSKPGLLSKKAALKKSEEIPEGSKPHHGFHVLVIGSVTGRINLKGKLLNMCRVSWGKVIKKSKIKNQESRVLIKYQPLIKKNKKLKLGKPIEKEILWDKNLIPNIKIGDWVSFHWNNLVQILNKKEVNNLNKYTNSTLKLLKNSLK